jgi:DNA-binding response OmpR family regulator
MSTDAATLGRPRVAVVDDEPDVLTFVRLALGDRGFDVLTLDRVEGALAALRAFGPDAVCLDLLMPERTGLSLLVEIRKDPDLARVPVLILSALNARNELLETLRREGLGPEPVAFVEKPLEMEALVRALSKCLGIAAGGAA